MSEAATARLRRGYYAATSYTDANVGKLLAELEATGQANNTAVVLLGDHGFNLGEGNLVRFASACSLAALIFLFS